MKLSFALAAILLLVSTIDCSKQKHHVARSLNLRAAENETCDVECTGGDAITDGSDFTLIFINGDDQVYIFFSASLKALIVYNSNNGFLVVFGAKLGFIAIINVNTDVGIVYNVVTGMAIVVEAVGIKATLGISVNLSASVTLCVNLVIKGAGILSSAIQSTLNAAKIFNLNVLLTAIIVTGNSFDFALGATLALNLTLRNLIIVNFKFLFLGTVSVANFAVLGIACLAIRIFGGIANLSTALLRTIIAFKVATFVLTATVVYKVIQRVIDLADLFKRNVITKFQVNGNLNIDCSTANGYNFSISKEGSLSVGGVVKGVFDLGANLASTLVGSLNLSAGISFGFGAGISVG